MRPLFGILLSVLCLVVLPEQLAAQVDVIRGKVTSADGAPLSGVRITATSIPGNVTRTARTDSRGSFQIAFPGGQGDYMMGYALVGYAFRQFEIKRTVDEDVLVADTRLQPMQLDTVVTTAPVQQRVSRYNAATPDVSGTERQVPSNALPPELQGNLAAIAASLPGVTLVPGTDGGADGFSVLGLGADANTTTLNGLTFGANGLPRDAAVSSSLTTSPFDPSRGGFSGGNLNLRSGSGSNFLNRGMSIVTNTPQLQWTDRAAQALGTEFTNISIGGLTSGPIKLNKAFYNVSYQFDHNTRANQTLLNTGALGLQTAGVAQDSVTRFLGILDQRGIPRFAGPDRQSRFNKNGSLFGSIDIQPPNAVNGDSYSIAFNGNFGKQSPVGGGATQLASSSGDRVNWGGGAQLRTNRYFGLILSESSVGLNIARNYGEAYLDLPSGRVRVNSILENGASGVQSLGFGGNQGLFGASRTVGATAQNTLSWFDDANKHRVKLTTELQYNGSQQNLANNLLGSFSYNSLADFEAGRPASFTRQLTARQRTTGQYTGAVALGDSWRRTPNVQIQYGIRVENTQYGQRPQYNADVSRLFDRRNDRVPTPIAISPRIGFSWTLGTSNDIAAFTGGFRAPRAVIRGGIGVFANGSAGGQLGSALDNTGLASGVQQLVCSGDAVPVPDWSGYSNNRSAIPERCADGTNGTVFANASPNVVLFARHFAPQRSVRSNLSWQGPILDARYSLNAEGTWALNLNQQQTVDLNFRADRQFGLDLESGRPVYVASTSIDPITGAIASRDARISSLFNRVSELRSDIRSTTSQLQLRLSPIQRTPAHFGWSAAYTLTYVREQVPGFQSTAGNPLGSEWAVSTTGPHQLSYNLRYNFFDYITVNWNGQFRSGNAFTPTVAGDINGDGYSNDRAFIYDPSAVGDAALASGLQQLFSTLPGSTRSCLDRQLGRVAERNSCRGPWSSSASMTITLDRAKFRMPQRASLNFSLSNPLGAADLALNGSGNLKGWGQSPFPDQSLFYVRGFDPITRRYKYEVNQRFGQTRPQFLTLRSPVTMTVSMRIDLGPTRERQTITQQLRAGRQTPGTRINEANFRQFGTNSVLNPMTQIIRQQDSLRLTSVQADSIASMNRRYTYRTDSLWTPVAQYLASLPERYQLDQAFDRYLRARRAQVDLLIGTVKAVSDLLTAEQKRKLPSQITNSLDPRYLNQIREGSGIYVSSGGGGFGGFGGFGGPPEGFVVLSR
ncbi:MAG: TonB-dependent receptor [Gemmatimonadaceae bacterium]|nr:TonB-dependent receptor [Gemmatimonadaceae bacterium]